MLEGQVEHKLELIKRIAPGAEITLIGHSIGFRGLRTAQYDFYSFLEINFLIHLLMKVKLFYTLAANY